MNLTTKRKFVRDLTRGIAINLIEKSRNWPPEWDGHELRVLVAEKARAAAKVSRIGLNSRDADSRTRDFWNTIMTRNVMALLVLFLVSGCATRSDQPPSIVVMIVTALLIVAGIVYAATRKPPRE